jgi:hypothetical protein
VGNGRGTKAAFENTAAARPDRLSRQQRALILTTALARSWSLFDRRGNAAGGNATPQIDVSVGGVMDANDIEIHLTNDTGTLHDSNFLRT